MQPLTNGIRVNELRNVGRARHVACMGENRSIWGLYLFHTIALVNKVKFSRYRPGVAQRVGTGIALLFHDRGTRRG